MPRKKVANVAWLRLKAQQRVQRAKSLQRQEERRFKIDQDKKEEVQKATDKNDGDEGDKERDSESIITVVKRFDAMEPCQNLSNISSKILDTLRKESAYCLTVSKLFWQARDRETDGGRRRP